jgi:hypothetical protein
MQTMDLQSLRIRVQTTLAFADQWPDETLNQWILDAIDTYSLEFPRPCRKDVGLTTDTQAYALPPDYIEMQRVEYPTGENPREWLRPVDLFDEDLDDQDDVYAIRPMDPDNSVSADVGAFEILFGPLVATGETARLYYLGHHITPASDSDYTSVPAAHAEALIAFVEFRAHWQLETAAAYTSDGSTLTISELGANARRAWNRYKEITDRLHSKTPPPTGRLTWHNVV